MNQSVVLEYSFTANGYAQPSGDMLLVRPRVVGRHARGYNDKPRIFPIDMEETGTWRDQIDLTLPAGYTVDDLPAAVDLDVGFASYKSDVKADGGVLHYTREYVVRQLDLGPEKSGDVSKLMAVIHGDETAARCSRRSKELDLVSRLGLGALHRACRQFENGVSGEASGEAPGRHGVPHFFHPVLAVEVDEVNRKAHEEGVNGFAGNNPEALSLGKSVLS